MLHKLLGMFRHQAPNEKEYRRFLRRYGSPSEKQRAAAITTLSRWIWHSSHSGPNRDEHTCASFARLFVGYTNNTELSRYDHKPEFSGTSESAKLMTLTALQGGCIVLKETGNSKRIGRN